MRPEGERHDRLMRLPPVLRQGFRPFFLGGAAWAAAVVALWVLVLSGRITLPSAFDPLAWHRHEMLFGYLGAVIAGFLLTMIPNRTGRLPVAGAPLAALFALWAAGRLAVLASAVVGAGLAFALDVGFLATMAAVTAREVAATRNRNRPAIAALALLAIADALDHAEALGVGVPAGLGWRLGFALVLVLIAFFGGRIIPSFTYNWLAKRGRRHGLPMQPGRFDAAVLAATVAALLAWVARPDAAAAAALLLLAGGLHTARLARWSGHRTLGEPFVFILHLSYAWLPVGLLLLGASRFTGAIPVPAALHALGAGAMGSMTLAVMTRTARAHTGRRPHADGWTRAVYALVTLGALIRVGAPMLPVDPVPAIAVAGTLWGAAFVLFILRHAPMLLGGRPGAGARRP